MHIMHALLSLYIYFVLILPNREFESCVIGGTVEFDDKLFQRLGNKKEKRKKR